MLKQIKDGLTFMKCQYEVYKEDVRPVTFINRTLRNDYLVFCHGSTYRCFLRISVQRIIHPTRAVIYE